MKKLKSHIISKSLLTGIFAGVGVVLIGAIITAYLIYSEYMSFENVGFAVVTTMLVASFVTAKITSHGKTKRLVWCLTGVLGVWLILILINLAACDGEISSTMIIALPMLAGGVSAALIGHPKMGKKKFKFAK